MENEVSHSRIWDIVFIGFIFFLPRIGFLAWYTNHSSAFQANAVSSREPSPQGLGGWTLLAKDFLSNKPNIASSDDIGFPLLIAGLLKLGVPDHFGFYGACLLAMSAAFIFLSALYEYLKKKVGRGKALVLVGFLSLYPPGIYYSFSLVARMLPVYAFLIAVVVVLYAPSLLQKISIQTFFIFIGVALTSVFLMMARNTNKPIFVALLAALAGLTLLNQWSLKSYGVLLLLFVCGAVVSKRIFPPLEHSAWHPIYLGLSDFDNKYQIESKDAFAKEKVFEFNPELRPYGADVDLIPAYEKTLKKMTLGLIRKDPIWYARILVMRVVKITVAPFQGSWLMTRGDNTKIHQSNIGSDLYSFVRACSAIFDLALTVLGGIVLAGHLWKKKFKEIFPYAFLLAGASYVYVLVTVSNRTIFLPATYFYQFFAVAYFIQLVSFRRGKDKMKPIF